jgi:hypothetical protein
MNRSCGAACCSNNHGILLDNGILCIERQNLNRLSAQVTQNHENTSKAIAHFDQSSGSN